MIVDFAVEREDEAPVGGQHRLVPGRGQVDDGETAVTEADTRVVVDPKAEIIRAAMRERARHLFEDGPVDAAGAQYPGNSAHAPPHSGCVVEMEGTSTEAARWRRSCSLFRLCLSQTGDT